MPQNFTSGFLAVRVFVFVPRGIITCKASNVLLRMSEVDEMTAGGITNHTGKTNIAVCHSWMEVLGNCGYLNSLAAKILVHFQPGVASFR